MIYTDIEGQLCTISEAIKMPSKQNDLSNHVDLVENGDSEDDDVRFQDDDVRFQDDDDEDNENAISVEKLKREIMGTPDSELKNLEAGMNNEMSQIKRCANFGTNCFGKKETF